jgi:hypothetical protein
MLCMLLPHSHHATASLAGVRGYCINVEQERRTRGVWTRPKVRSRQEILIVISVILGRAVASMRSYQSLERFHRTSNISSNGKAASLFSHSKGRVINPQFIKD